MIEEILKRIIDIREIYINEAIRIKKNQPDWFNLKDTRSTILGNCSSDIGNAAFCLINAAGYMIKPEWWFNHFKISPPLETCRNYAQRHCEFTKLGFVVVFFSNLESSIRQIIRAIHPGKHSNSTTSFYTIYTDLLNELDIRDYIITLDMFREIRNVCHNNGVYFNIKGNKELHYKGKKYVFKNEEKLDFVTWELIFDLLEDVFNMIKKIIYHPEVFKINFIEDPFNKDKENI